MSGSTATAVAMPISLSKMGLEICNKTMGAARPGALFLGDGLVKEDEGLAASATRVQRKKKKCRAADARVKKFTDIYETTGESLGEGSFGHVTAYRNVVDNKEYAVKMIEKSETKSRQRVLKEIEIFHYCQGHENILQMVEYFEEDDRFYLVFEKMEGGTLLDCILRRGHLTEQEASLVVRDIASGLNFLHKKGIAHRDLKPENILCVKAGQLTPVKICDFDLGSGIRIGSRHCSPVTTPELLSPVGSADFMAPEVVDVWQYQAWSYDKRCDLWSLGTILYILLCGYRPFYAHCGKDCGFDEGLACEACQELLFKCIQQGVYTFADPDWTDISADAKDLIQHLLVKNPYQRYTAEQVLRHPWLSNESSRAPLATPYILSRNNSVRELGMFAETANAVNRLIQRHLSINEVCASAASFQRAHDESAQDGDGDESAQDGGDESARQDGGDETVCSSPDHTRAVSQREFGIFQLGISEEDDCGIGRWSDDDDDRGVEAWGGQGDRGVDAWRETPPSLATWTSLSPPGDSRLAKRRAFKIKYASESSVDSGNVSGSGSPPDVCLAPAR